MRGLLEGVPDPAAVLDSQLRYVAFNGAYTELLREAWGTGARLGSTVEAALGRQAAPDGRTVSDAFMAARAGSSASQLLGGLRAHYHPLRGDGGQVCGVLHLLQDVRAHDLAGEVTSASWLRLGQVLHLAGAPPELSRPPRIRVFAWDARLGDLAWSGSLQDFAGLASRLPAPPGPAERMHPEDSRRLAERISAWQREGRTEASFDFRIVQPDGTERWMDAWARLVPAGDAMPARLVGINVDVTDMVRTERELRESRAAYERLFDVSPDGIALLSLAPGGPPRILRANVALGHLAGRTPSELEDRVFSSLAPAPERAALERQLNALTAGGGLVHEFTLETPTGRQLRVEATSRAFDEGGHGLILSLVRDVMPRILREQDLLTREQWFRTLAEALPSIVWSADSDGKVEYYNANWFTYTGLSATVGFGEGWTEVIHNEDRLRMQQAWRHAVEHSERYEQEGRVRGKDGRFRWFLHRGYPVQVPGQERPRWIGTSTDIDLIKASEVALRERERWLGSIVDTIPHMLWTADAQGRVEFHSRQLVQYTGGPPPPAPRLPWAFHPDDEARASETWHDMLRGGTATSGEFRLRRHDGAYRWFSVAAAPLKDVEGQVIRWTGTWTDVTPQKEALDLLHEADRRKDEFLAVLSHELRNPLAPIRLSLGILERVPPGSPAWRRAFDILHRQSDQLARLVDDLLDLTRMTRGKIHLQVRTLDLVALVAECAEDHRGEFERQGLRLDVSLPGQAEWVQADGLRLSQAVGNLLQNAVKFTPRGGTARVSVQPHGTSVDVVVEDTGQGISPEMALRLFEPFAQEAGGIERSKGGLGLGLALVRTLVQMHGGHVAASSEGVGRGARFTVTLPTTSPPPQREERAPAHAPPERRRVLVIEDNVDAAESLQALLELDGHAVTVATDGQSGVERALALRPDVVLCDIGLPGMDGYSVARALRTNRELDGTRIYALTGYASAEDVRRAKAAGFSALIPKPATEAQLVEAVAGRA